MEQRKLLLSIMVVGMFSSAALAVTPMGAPVAGLAEGQYSLGLGFALTDQTLEVSGPVGSLTGDAELDVESMLYYGCIGYGISNEWNIGLALGMADAEFDADSTSPAGDDFDGDSEFGYGVVVKRTLYDNGDDTKWGTIFQYCTGESSDKISRSSSYGNSAFSAGANYDLELDWYQIQLALGPAVQVNEELCIYGGPFIHLFEGDIKVDSTSPGADAEYELEQLFELGGYIGLMLDLGNRASLSLEFLATGEAWGAGIGAMFPM
jgi:hypothetical protein